MQENETILSIDDNPTNQKLINAALKHDYDVHLASNGQEGLDMLASITPRVILLDIDMPVMNGYEVCEKIRETHSMDDLPIMFISALDKVPERLMGYEVGGNDYMVKPVDIAEVKHKIRRLIEFSEQQQSLKASIQSSTQTAMSVMTYSGELGVIIEFFENAVASYDFDTLAQHTLDACSKFGIESSLQIRPGNDLLEWSSTGAVCPLESQLLERGAQSKRIVTHKDYMFFNAPEITLLLKKLPLDDSDKVGRIRDHAAIIIKGLEAQIKVIQSRQASKKRRATAIDTLSNKSMSLIENLLNESTQFSHDIEDGYDELQVRIKETAAINELDTSQEQAILEDVAGYAKKMKAALIFVEHFNEAMTDLTWQLNEISKMD